MNQKAYLKLQACLDGELSAREARRVAAWLERDPQARAVFDELTLVRSTVRGHEPERALPESREFYWGKIQTAIEREDRRPGVLRPALLEWLRAWQRRLLPIAGFAMVMFVALVSILWTTRSHDGFGAEVENLDENVSSISFRNYSENMFVVWLVHQDNAPEQEEEFDWENWEI